MTERKVGPDRTAQGAERRPPAGAPVQIVTEGLDSRWPPTAARNQVGGAGLPPVDPPEHRFRRILGAYLAGAEEIVVRETPRLGPETRTVIDAFRRRTVGMEVAFEGPSEIRLRESAEPARPPLARQVDAIGRSVVRLHRDAVGSWGVLPLVDDEAWEREDDAIDREVWYVQRCLTKGSFDRPAEVLATWTIARSLERIADHATSLGRLGPRLGEVPGGEGLLRTLRQYHAQAMVHLEGSLRSRDAASANRWLDVGEALLSSGVSLGDRLLPAFEECSMPASGAAAVTQALESTRRTIAYAQDIAEVPLNAGIVPSDLGGGSARVLRPLRTGAPTGSHARGPTWSPSGGPSTIGPIR
jgi:phosphate uptake regulator